MSFDETIRSEAALWAARTNDPDFDDWSGFTSWLERHPLHNDAYEAVMLAADQAVELASTVDAHSDPVPVAANDEDGVRVWSASRRWLGGALAASIAAIFSFTVFSNGPTLARYETEAGQMLAIDLEGGATIELAGGSEITVAGEDKHRVTLIEGQAIFSIEPGGAMPFEVVAGPDTIVDIGTVFDVSLSAGRLQVEVAEGAVIVNPDTRSLRLDPGQALSKEGGLYTVSDIGVTEVGEWREGRVSFRKASLAEVADRLSRATGVEFRAPSANGQRFSGSVLLEPIKSDPATLGALLDLEIERTDEGWLLEPR